MLLSATICPPSYYRAGWLKVQERDHSLKDQIAEGARQMRYQPENIRILGMGGNFTSVGLQVTLCDPMWHVSSRSGVATLRTVIHLLLTYLLTSFSSPAFRAPSMSFTRSLDNSGSSCSACARQGIGGETVQDSVKSCP